MHVTSTLRRPHHPQRNWPVYGVQGPHHRPLHTRHMAPLSRQRIRAPRTRSPRQTGQTYQYNVLYSFLSGPQAQTTYLCPFRLQLPSQKAEPYRTRLTVGGNLIDYPGNLSMKVADMTTFKILVNSTLSTPGARWLGLDVKTTI